jgi:hypothetical protein
MDELLPKISLTDNDYIEIKSVSYLERLFSSSRQLKTHFASTDKIANIDGYFELLDTDGRIEGKITVQIKTYQPSYIGKNKYDIDGSLLGYSDRMKTEVVILYVVDNENECIYWKYIDGEYISQCKSKGIQGKYTYHFKNEESFRPEELNDAISRWRLVYNEKKESIKNLQKEVNERIDNASQAFEQIYSYFYGLPSSYIERKEVDTLYNWIQKENTSKNSNIRLIIGDAGIGKSVVIKQLLRKLEQNKIPVFAIKADMAREIEYESLKETFSVLVKKNDSSVLLIDQIDALSQSLSNDRSLISCYLRLINHFSLEEYNNVKIVVSCRKFDLEYDHSLSALKNNNVITIEKLRIEEVKQITELLMGKVKSDQLSQTTVELLRTPQYLDIFCRIYGSNSNDFNYFTPQSLYDALWNILIHHSERKTTIKAENIESFIFNLAKKMHETETLTPCWIATGLDIDIINYLSTECIITYNNKDIRFFHQSFYDYTISRYYSLSNHSLYEMLIKQHQGLFIRSTTKQVILYQKEHNLKLYQNDLKVLLFSDKIRFHIKLILLQLLASEENPSSFEKKLILSLKKDNNELFISFLQQSTSIAWFDFLVDYMINDISFINNYNDEYSLITSNWLRRFASERADIIYEVIDNVRNEDIREKIAQNVLTYTTDYISPKVIEWYKNLKMKGLVYSEAYYLQQALSSNPKFVCSEVEVYLKKSISEMLSETDIYYRNRSTHGDNMYDDVCAPIVKQQPLLIYPILKKVYQVVLEKTRYNYGGKELDGNDFFSRFDPDYNDHHKIIVWLKEILSTQLNHNIPFVKDEIEYYFSLKESTSCCIALEVMSYAPSLFLDELFCILSDKTFTESLLDYGDQNYYFRDLLKNAYEFFSEEQKQYYHNYILSHNPNNEKVPSKRFFNRLYPSIGNQQRELIYTLPPDDIIGELKRKKFELDRRFDNRKCENRKPDYRISAGTVCGGLVSTDKYKKISPEQWIKSFIESKNPQKSNNRYMYFDSRVHAKAYRENVSRKPKMFQDSVYTIFNMAEISLQYKIGGLCGLLDGNLSIEEIFPLCKQLLEAEYKDHEKYEILELLKLLSNRYFSGMDYIISFLIKIIQTEYVTKYTLSLENEANDTSATLSSLTSGVNSIQGRAIECLIQICAIVSKREYIYNEIYALYPSLSMELKLVILYYIYYEEYYDKDLFEKLLILSLKDNFSDILYVRGDAINRYLHEKQEIVLPYMNNVLKQKRAQPLLVQLTFLGVGYGSLECQKLLETLLSENTEEIISNALRMSSKNLRDSTYRELSLNILRRFSSDPREKIIENYCFAFHDFLACDFEFFLELFDKLYSNLDVGKIYGIFEYLKKNCTIYPVECYKCIDLLIKLDRENNMREEDAELELLLAVYKSIKNDVPENSEILEKIMDTFDFMMKNNLSAYRMNKVLQSVERM